MDINVCSCCGKLIDGKGYSCQTCGAIYCESCHKMCAGHCKFCGERSE